MKTHEFKIGAVYSPDGGRTTMLIAAPSLPELKRAWRYATFIEFDKGKAFTIDAIIGEDQADKPTRPE